MYFNQASNFYDISDFFDQNLDWIMGHLKQRVDIVHKHSPECGHIPIKHGDHIDYIVDGILHHPHGNHCDDHGPIKILSDKKDNDDILF